MLSADDFKLPLEKSLRLRVIKDEIRQCTDLKQMREICVTMAEQNMTFQHIIGRILLADLEADLKLILEAEEKGELK